MALCSRDGDPALSHEGLTLSRRDGYPALSHEGPTLC